MSQQKKRKRDSTEFQVNFLGKFHEVYIDWNDDNEFKQQQLFEQLEEITGITRHYTPTITLHRTRLGGPNFWPGEHRYLNIVNNIIYDDMSKCNNNFKKEEVKGICIQDGERFYLKSILDFEPRCINRLAIGYELVPEAEFIEGECTSSLCQTAISKPFFKRMKSLVLNDALNEELAGRIDKLIREGGDNYAVKKRAIFRDFNILQISEVICDFHVKAGNIDRRFEHAGRYP